MKEILQLSLASGKELNTSSLLTHYDLVQSISYTLKPKLLLHRIKSHEQIKQAIAAHNHDATIVVALFKDRLNYVPQRSEHHQTC